MLNQNPHTNKEFKLIETILWENNAFFLLDLHLKRLKNSSLFFNFQFNEKNILHQLENIKSHLSPNNKYYIRLLLNKKGTITINHNIFIQETLPLKITFSKKTIDKNNIFLYHKTTNREIYSKELEYYKKKGIFDIIFLNKQKEITEGSITNIIIEKNKQYYTPPISSGILNGVYRQYLFASKQIYLKEKILYKKDLLCADNIFLINSVRKKLQVSIT